MRARHFLISTERMDDSQANNNNPKPVLLIQALGASLLIRKMSDFLTIKLL